MSSSSSAEDFQDAQDKPLVLYITDSEEYSDSEDMPVPESSSMQDRSDERFRALFSELFDLFDRKANEVQRLRGKTEELENMLKIEKSTPGGQPDDSKLENLPLAYPTGSSPTHSSEKSLSEDETSTSALEKKIKVLSEQNASQTDELTLMRIENENLKKKIADMEVSLKASVDFQTFARGTLNQLVSEKRKLTNELAAFKGTSSSINSPKTSYYYAKGTSTDITDDKFALQIRDQESIIASQLEEIKNLNDKIAVLESNNASNLNDLWGDLCDEKIRATSCEKERDEAIAKLEIAQDDKRALELQLSLLLCDDEDGSTQQFTSNADDRTSAWISSIRQRAASSKKWIKPHLVQEEKTSDNVWSKSFEKPESSKIIDDAPQNSNLKSSSGTTIKSDKSPWNFIQETFKSLDSITKLSKSGNPPYSRFTDDEFPLDKTSEKKEECSNQQKEPVVLSFSSDSGFTWRPVFSGPSPLYSSTSQSPNISESINLNVSQQLDDLFSKLTKPTNDLESPLSIPPECDHNSIAGGDKDVDDQIETIDKEVTGLNDQLAKLMDDFDENLNLSSSSEETNVEEKRRSSVSSDSSDDSWEKLSDESSNA